MNDVTLQPANIHERNVFTCFICDRHEPDLLIKSESVVTHYVHDLCIKQLQAAKAPIINRNEDLLENFTTYCEEHKQERFYQALANWSGRSIFMRANYIYVNTYSFDGKDG